MLNHLVINIFNMIFFLLFSFFAEAFFIYFLFIFVRSVIFITLNFIREKKLVWFVEIVFVLLCLWRYITGRM